MYNLNKQINPKWSSLIVTLIFIGTILFMIFGKKLLIFLLIAVGVYLWKKYGQNVDLSFINNSLNKNNMINQTPGGSNFSDYFGKIGKVVKYLIVIIVVIWIIYWCVVIIGPGETGVFSLFGKVSDQELPSGLNFINPLGKVQKMSIRTEQYTMSIAANEGQRKGDDSISSLTKEGLDVNIDFTALYRLEEKNASDIYKQVGLDYIEKIIRPEIRGVIRDIVSQYEAKELYSEKRQEASSRMANLLREKLEGWGIVIEEAVIRNVQLPPSLAKAIQDKLAAEQEAQRYDFVLDKEKKEADRKRIEAEGQRDAQKIIDESLSSEYLNYLYINQLKERPGTIYVPVNPENGMPLFKGINP